MPDEDTQGKFQWLIVKIFNSANRVYLSPALMEESVSYQPVLPLSPSPPTTCAVTNAITTPTTCAVTNAITTNRVTVTDAITDCVHWHHNCCLTACTG